MNNRLLMIKSTVHKLLILILKFNVKVSFEESKNTSVFNVFLK